MANNDKNKDNMPNLDMKTIKDLAKSVQTLSDDIYADTYYIPKSGTNSLDDIRNGITKSLDAIVQNNLDSNGTANISSVYSRMISSNSLKDGISADDKHALEKIFDDPSLIGAAAESYAANSYIKQFDAEIDMICKYLPKLEEAIEVKKDMVLCADQFNRDFLTISDKSSIQDNDYFNSEIDVLKEKYDLAELFETAVYNAWKYGEDFIYITPYRKALQDILDKRQNRVNHTDSSGNILTEYADIKYPSKYDDNNKVIEESEFKIEVSFNMDNALTESIKSINEAVDSLDHVIKSSINESVEYDLSPKVLEEVNKTNLKMDPGTLKAIHNKKIIPDDTVPEDTEKYNTAVDGIINTDTIKSKKNELISKIPGCLVKHLERHKVIPIYIEGFCMGYYYIETVDTSVELSSGIGNTYGFNNSVGDTLQRYNQQTAMSVGANSLLNNPLKNDTVLKQAAGKIASLIDAKFINTNQDLAKEIYMILKYDENFNHNTKKINVTYIPAGDIVHVYFKINKDTHRGISLLERALIPAKIAIALNMCSAVGIMTRGIDKRVYYVKQQVETNISKTLLSAINQIKKGNFGVRNLENLMSTLNITGAYNDYFIPQSANGESPIQFEVLQGQDIDTHDEFVNKFEDYAIGTTGVPMDLITARASVDYATQLTMTNTKHMRMTYKDQSRVQIIGSKIVTIIYNAEYNKTSQLAVTLPPPLYITLTNSAQILTNAMDLGQKIMEPMLKERGASDEIITSASAEYAREVLGTYINFDRIYEIVNRTILKNKLNEIGNTEE